jgi:AhpD family alkylhydroperoxidase
MSDLASEHGVLLLAPIDRPRSWFARLINALMRSRYGVTPTAFRVLYARAPFLAFISLVIIFCRMRRLALGAELASLIQVSVAMRNGCTFCSDLHMAEAVRERLGVQRFRSLLEFETSDAFSAREKAALRYPAALHESLHIPDQVWSELRANFSERECVEIVWLCAVERYFNALALPLRIGSDELAARAHPAAYAGAAERSAARRS